MDAISIILNDTQGIVCTRSRYEGTLYFFSRSLRFIRNKTSNKVHPNFDFPMDAY